MSFRIRLELGWLCGLLAGLIALPGCSGGQTGDGTGTLDDDQDPDDGNTTGEGGHCNYQTQPLASLNDASELGFSAQDILNFALAPVSTSFAWGGSELVEVGPETGVGTLDLALNYSGGAVRIRRQGPPPSAGEGPGNLLAEIEVNCPTALEIDVSGSFRTGGGALNETFETMLVAEVAGLATFIEPLDLEDLDGSLEVLSTRPAGGVLKQVQIQGSVSPLGSYGSVTGVLEYRTNDAVGDAAVGGAGQIGHWPAESACGADNGTPGLSVAADADLGGYTSADALALVAALSPAPLRWQDATETTLTLAIEPSGGTCARFEPDDVVSSSGILIDEPVWRLSTPVNVAATSADGRWQGEYTGSLSAVPNPSGGLALVRLRAFIDNVAPENFATASGFSAVDLSGYDYGRVFLEIELEVEAGNHTARVRVEGATEPDCAAPAQSEDPNPANSGAGGASSGGASAGGAEGSSSPGCAGTNLTTVWSGTF